MPTNDLTLILSEIAVALRPSAAAHRRAHYIAAANWLKRYRPKPGATNLEQVRGYLEAFDHLCHLELWPLAYRLMDLPTTSPRPLHDQLGRWGYETERIRLYAALRGRLSLGQEAVLLDGLGHAHHGIGQYDLALRVCEAYGKVVEALDDPVRQIRHLGLLGITHHAMGNYGAAADYHQQRLAQCQELGPGQAYNRYLEKMNALGDLGIAEHSLGNYAAAQAHHEAQLTLARETGSRSAECQALGSLGHVYDALGQHEAAIACYEQCLAIARELGDRLGECGALGGLGNVHKNRQNWGQAQAYYEQGLAIALEIGHRRGEGVALANLASVYRAQGKVAPAYETGLGCLAIAQETQNAGAEAQALHTLGLILQASGEYEGALELLAKALDRFEDMGDVNAQGATLFNLGHVCAALGEVEEGWRCWLFSLAVFVELGLRHRVEMVLEALYRQICLVLGDGFWKGQDFTGALEAVFGKSLAAVEEVFGMELRELVWQELMKLRGDV